VHKMAKPTNPARTNLTRRLHRVGVDGVTLAGPSGLLTALQDSHAITAVSITPTTAVRLLACPNPMMRAFRRSRGEEQPIVQGQSQTAEAAS